MTRKATRRKHHYAKGSGLLVAMEGASVIQARKLGQLRLRELSTIEAFVKGNATRDDWLEVAGWLNCSQTMAESNIGPEAIEAVNRCQAALELAYARNKATGRLVLDAAGIKAVRDMHEYYDLQRTSIDLRTYEAMLRKTIAREQSAHPSMKVLPP